MLTPKRESLINYQVPHYKAMTDDIVKDETGLRSYTAVTVTL